MTFHLFGNILTFYGVAANNRGENQGNIITLQKLLWKGEPHTKISAEAIRWAIRYYWQQAGYAVNRVWNDDLPNEQNPQWQDLEFNPVDFIDDDVLGFMETESAKKENSDENNQQQQDNDENPEAQNEATKTNKRKRKKKIKPKGKVTNKRGRLDVNPAISTTPYDGNVTFNAKSGKKDKKSLYSAEFHDTSYQYGLGITPESCKDKSRFLALLDAIVSIRRVGGNHGRFLFDFAPESVVLRWTQDFAPRFLYCFEEDEMGDVFLPKLSRQIRTGDLDPKEFWIGGKIVETLEDSKYERVNKFEGVKATVNALKQRIADDLQFCLLDEPNQGENLDDTRSSS